MKSTAIKTNDYWIDAYRHCTETHPYDEIERLAVSSIGRIREIAGKYRRIAYGWNGGKDSVVLQHLIERSGIEATPIMWRGINEFPEVARWIDANAPEGTRFVPIDRFTFDYLNAHPKLLFCQDGTRTEWMKEKWRVMRLTMRDFDLLITGRRIHDGNVCGKDGLMEGSYDTYSPIFDWTNDEMLAYIRHNDIRLSPYYSYPRGFLIGSVSTGEWTEYAAKGLTEKEVFDEIWNIDSSIIKNAKGLKAAERYLEARDED